MKLFSDCSNKCDTCITHYFGSCLAGHGDDGYSPISITKATEILTNIRTPMNTKINILKLYPELADNINITNIIDNEITIKEKIHKSICLYSILKYQTLEETINEILSLIKLADKNSATGVDAVNKIVNENMLKDKIKKYFKINTN